MAFAVAPASAAEFPYTVEPELSLTGDCSTSAFDPVPDPDCEPTYPPPPAGPTGRFFEPWSVAIDAYGNEYVASWGGNDGTKGRIDVFDDEGRFITELADPRRPQSIAVDSKGNLYAFEQLPGGEGEIARYTPSEYKPEEGKIAYGNPRVVVDSEPTALLGGVAVDLSNDHLYASWWGTFITEYESAADGNDLLETITPPGLFANQRLAVDGQNRRVYASSCTNSIFDCVVLVFEADAPYSLLEEVDGSETPVGEFLSVNGKLAVAVDEESGNFFVGDLSATSNIYEFNEDYEYLSTSKVPGAQANTIQIAVSNSPLNPTARNFRYLFAPLSATSGSVIAFEPPAVQAPRVDSLVAVNIAETEAELRGIVDPEGAETEYVIEYVSQAQFEATGFDDAVLVGDGTIVGSSTPQQVTAFIDGLTPETAYRFRIVAENEVGEDEVEATFTTFADADSGGDGCSNAVPRAGFSLALPDCRAYELVTPPDTNGNPTKGGGSEGDRFGSVQSAPAAGLVSFELLGGALPGTEATGGIYGDPYLATRGDDGWSTELVGPNGTQTSQPRPGSFSPDQGYNFWLAAGEGSALVGGLETRYIRYPDGHSELVGRGSLGTDQRAIGRLITEGGSHIVFETELTPKKLEPNAPPDGTTAVYDRTADEVTHVVSLLPGNVTPAAGQNATYLNASADGEGIAFSIGSTLYLRVGNTTTYNIGTGVQFAGVSEGGARIFYVQGGDLKAFDVEDEAVVDFTPVTDAVPVNVASDGTRAYFVSEQEIGGSGPNPNGANPQLGEQNLYLSEEGTISFVGTVTERDVEGEPSASGQLDGLGGWSAEAQSKRRLAFDPSRLTPDGSVMLFQSRANLDDYDPGDFPQIYRFDSAGDRLDCISCPPTKAAPVEGAALQSFQTNDHLAPFGAYGYVPNLRADGNRAFFESTEALVSGDTDGERDVYEWEEEDVGSCTKPGGCIYLISNGHSESGDYLFGHSASGDDAFFTTNDILVGGDESSLSVYDARVNGGFAESTPPICQGEGCRPNLTPPPAVPAPQSGARPQSGNVVPKPKPKTCPKGKKKVKKNGKVRCVKKKKPAKHKNKQKAGNKRKGGQR
ncbi:MAG TPA: hypothetical protein VI039_01990 [Solirubrobacterales bacterium]